MGPCVSKPILCDCLQVAAAKLAASKKSGSGTGGSQLPGLTVGNAAAVDAALSAAESAADDEVVAAARERLDWRLGVLTSTMEQLLQHVFGLLGRLSEVCIAWCWFSFFLGHRLTRAAYVCDNLLQLWVYGYEYWIVISHSYIACVPATTLK